MSNKLFSNKHVKLSIDNAIYPSINSTPIAKYSMLAWMSMIAISLWGLASDFGYAYLMQDETNKAIEGLFFGLTQREMTDSQSKIISDAAWFGSIGDAIAGVLLIANTRHLIEQIIEMKASYQHTLQATHVDYHSLPNSELKRVLQQRANRWKELQQELTKQNAIIADATQTYENKQQAKQITRTTQTQIRDFNSIATLKPIITLCTERLANIRITTDAPYKYLNAEQIEIADKFVKKLPITPAEDQQLQADMENFLAILSENGQLEFKAKLAAAREIMTIINLKDSYQRDFIKPLLMPILVICGIAYGYGSLAPLLGLVAAYGCNFKSLSLGVFCTLGQFWLYVLTSGSIPLNAAKAIVRIRLGDNENFALRDVFSLSMLTTVTITSFGVLNRLVVFGFNGRQIEPTLNGPDENHWSSITQAVIAASTCAIMTILTQQFYSIEAEIKRLANHQVDPNRSWRQAFIDYIKHAFTTTFLFTGAASQYHTLTKIFTIALSLVSTLTRALSMPAFFNGMIGNRDPENFNKICTVIGLIEGPFAYVIWYKFLKGNLPNNIEYLAESIQWGAVKLYQALLACPRVLADQCCPPVKTQASDENGVEMGLSQSSLTMYGATRSFKNNQDYEPV